MKALLKTFIALLAATTVLPAKAAHTQADLVLSATAVKPGDTILAAVRLRMDPEWHTYWKNSGDSGMATKTVWQLPPGITAGETQWPVPEKLTAEGLTSYLYEDEAVLLTPLKVAPDARAGSYDIKAKVSWLECQLLCVPGSTEVQAHLEIASATKPSDDSGSFAAWQAKLPKSSAGLSPHAYWEKAAVGDTRMLIIEWTPTAAASTADFYPDPADDFEIQAGVDLLSTNAGKIQIRKVVHKLMGDWPKTVSGLLIQKTGTQVQAYKATMTVSASGTAAGATSTSEGTAETTGPPPGTSGQKSLALMLLYAFIGGLILNIMPCVLPVIALKILGFVSQAKDHPRKVRWMGLTYAAGVLVSFLVLAAIVIGIKAAGHQAGWGMQFGNPTFVVALTVLVTLVALNLFGVFEITLSGRLMGATNQLTSKEGVGGAFFNGVLATALATPCTAPFLGAALGFAFAQSAGLIVLMFLVIGAGLAAPYVVLSWEPGWLKFLPKPGAWMEKFKIAMGFPMLATAVWLFYLTFDYFGKRTLWIGLFLVIAALATWVFGEFVQRGRTRRGLALVISLGLLIVGSAYSFKKLNAPETQWQPWSQQAVAKARAEGRPVLVDFTADWCLTCNTVVKPALESSSVQTKLSDINAVKLLADYTRISPEITEELARFKRAGVPLVLVYPRNADKPAIVLPEALTAGMVLNALEKAVE